MTQISGPAPVMTVKELKSGVSISDARLKTQNDGLDEIFVQSNDGKNYVAYAKEIENVSSHRKGDQITLNTADGKQVSGTIAFVDDEITSAKEGAIKPFKDAAMWVMGAAGGGAGLTVGVLGTSSGTALGIGTAAATGLGVGLVLAGGGMSAMCATIGAIKKTNSTNIESLSQ